MEEREPASSQSEPQVLPAADSAPTLDKRHRSGKTFVGGCISVAPICLLIGCALFYIVLLRPRLVAAVQTVQTTQPVCGTWSATSGSLIGSALPQISALAAITEADVWGITSEGDAYHWNGADWSSAALPKPPAASDVHFSAITSLPNRDVWIAGSYEQSAGIQRALTYRLSDGHWSLVNSVDVSGANVTLSSVSGSAGNDLWAVGSYERSTQKHALAMHWDGLKWSEAPALGGCLGNQEFFDIMTLDAHNAWAVGECSDSTQERPTQSASPLIQHWNGTEWQEMTTPKHNGGLFLNSSSLTAVSGTASDDLWVVGNYWDSNVGYGLQPMIQHWDGYRWRESKFPSVESYTTRNLLDVLSLSRNNAWAVGLYSISELRPLAFHWNGSDWREAAIPNPLAEGYYSSIASPGQDSLWAAGYSFDTEDGAQYGLLARFRASVCPR